MTDLNLLVICPILVKTLYSKPKCPPCGGTRVLTYVRQVKSETSRWRYKKKLSYLSLDESGEPTDGHCHL